MNAPDKSATGPMLEEDGKEFSERWGYLSRAGLNYKSCLTRQIEKYADTFSLLHLWLICLQQRISA